MFEWADFLAQARNLISDGTEVSLRSAIDRAYYSAYNQVVTYLLDCGASVNSKDHQATWNLLDSGKGAKPQLVKRGHYFRHWRNKASYDLDLPPNTNLLDQARKAITDAEYIRSILGV